MTPASLGDLRDIQEQRLRDGLLAHAARSALYRERWRAAGVDPGAVRALDHLARVPYVRGADLREAWRHPAREVLCDPAVRLWFATSGTTGAPKWTPYGATELRMFEEVVLRAYAMLVPAGTPLRAAIFSTPAPFVSDASAYALLASTLRAALPIEYVITSPTEARAALGFLAARRPDIVIGFPSLLLRIAEGVREEAPASAREAWRERRSLRTLAAVALTSVVPVTARQVFRPSLGLFGGEALAPYRDALRQAWGLRAYELYGMTEFPCFHVECREQAGVHVWADWCIPEIIPLADLDREEGDPGFRPEAHHLFDASPGELGEFVFTSFSDVLPLVRYRTGDVVEVVDTARCACGRPHPRIRARGRRDDLVNLGLIRFGTSELDGRLSAVAGIASWQLRIVRRGYKPQPVLYVVPATPAPPDLAARAAAALGAIEILRVGIENGLVLDPEVRVVPRIEEVRTWSGKRRRVIEES